MNPTVKARITWLKDELHLPVQDNASNKEDSPPTVPSIRTPLTEQVVEQVFRDASNEVLLQLNRRLKELLRQRSRPVKVALSVYNACFSDRCCSESLRFETCKSFVVKYLSDHQPSWANNEQVINLIARYSTCSVPLEGSDDDLISVSLESPVDDIARIVGCEPRDAKTVLWRLIDVFEEEGQGNYDEFFSMDVNDPYFIAAVERLIAQGKPPKDIILVTVNVPLGKTIDQHFDMRYGDYVELVDDE